MKQIVLAILVLTIGIATFYCELEESIAVTAKKAEVNALFFKPQKISASLKKRMEGKSYRKNPHIKINDLRYIRIKHYNFQGKVKEGELVVNKKIAKDVGHIFAVSSPWFFVGWRLAQFKRLSAF